MILYSEIKLRECLKLDEAKYVQFCLDHKAAGTSIQQAAKELGIYQTTKVSRHNNQKHLEHAAAHHWFTDKIKCEYLWPIFNSINHFFIKYMSKQSHFQNNPIPTYSTLFETILFFSILPIHSPILFLSYLILIYEISSFN